MKHMKKFFALALAAIMLFACIPSAFAATAEISGIDMDADCSLTIYKYNWTDAYKDGIVDEDTFVSSGWKDSVVEEVLGDIKPRSTAGTQTLGNGQSSNGYAIKGVEFTITYIALPMYFPGRSNLDNNTPHTIFTLYTFSKEMAADLLTAIGLPDGQGATDPSLYYDDLPDDLNEYWFYTSDVLVSALSTALETNSTQVKNALESYVINNGGIAMEKTDADGRTSIDGLDVGLYLVVETAVPEMVTNTTNPFFVSLPMTTVNNNTDGTAPEGGSYWNYDVTVYPKNETGILSLEKTVREAEKDTGKHTANQPRNYGFNHYATGSAGDTMEYQIVSTLPAITSQATALTTYNFFDTIAPGMTYNDDVVIEFFTDKKCTNKVTTWAPEDGKFTVSYSDDGQSMTIDITETGLAEICGDTENINGSLYVGYSNYTLRVTYSAEINSDNSFVYGEEGNCNMVVLTWKRTSAEYYDTLIDDCHVYSFGINLTKEFKGKTNENSEADGLYDNVKFIVKNTSDDYWVIAELNEEEGIYYVTGFTPNEAEATEFTPVTSGEQYGKIIVRGIEDDIYEVYEIQTANGYTLLPQNIRIEICYSENEANPCDIYTLDICGLLQNDPRYAFDGDKDLIMSNIPQQYLEHYGISPLCYVDSNIVNMQAVGDSANAEVPLVVLNTPGFDLPQTGDNGVWMYGVAGGTLMMAAALVVLFAFKKKENKKTVSH